MPKPQVSAAGNPANLDHNTSHVDEKPDGSVLSAANSLQPTPISPDSPHWTHRLVCGTSVLIRPIGTQDAELERRFIERLSPESRRFRFLGQIGSPSEETIRRMTEVDYARDVAFVALLHEDGEKKEIGVARYGLATDGQSCECAVTVSDAWQQKGLGTLLMRHLIDIARERGIQRMLSMDAAANVRMRELATHLGFTRHADPEDASQVIHTLELQGNTHGT